MHATETYDPTVLLTQTSPIGGARVTLWLDDRSLSLNFEPVNRIHVPRSTDICAVPCATRAASMLSTVVS